MYILITKLINSLEPFEVKEIYYGIYDDYPIIRGTTATAFSTIGGSLVGTLIKKTNTTDSSEANSHWEVYLKVVNLDERNPTEPYLIYQTPVPYTTISVRTCASAYDGSGHQCIINTQLNTTTLRQNPITGTFENKTVLSKSYIRVKFLSTGAVTAVKELATYEEFEEKPPTIEVYSLRYGGYLLVNMAEEIRVDLYDESGTYIQRLDLPADIHTTSYVSTFPNNSAWTVSEVFDKTWSFISTDVPKLLPNGE
jgi:hypothetical protein